MRFTSPATVTLSRALRHVAALPFVLLAACGGGDATAPCTVSAVTVTPSTAGLRIGATSQLAASVNATNCSATPNVVWSTGDAGVATVSSTGLVTAVATGTTTISATAQSIQTGATITVSLIPVQSVTVTASSTTLLVGASAQATAVVRDSAGATVARPLTWTTSDAAVATVNGSGLVTAVAAGTATITATAGGVAGTLVFTSTAAVATVTTALSTRVVFLGTTLLPHGTATTRDGTGAVVTGRAVTWSSTNTAVATVDATTGVITPIAEGATNIRATSEGITGQSALTVTQLPTAANRFGYTWNERAAAPLDSVYTPFSLYTVNASGGAISIRRAEVGTYIVRFDGAANRSPATMSDVVLVTAYGSPSVQCSVGTWTSANVTDLDVVVRCSDLAGIATNASFNVVFIGGGSLGGKNGFLWTPDAAGGGISPSYAFSTGGAPAYTRSSTGTYSVTFGTGTFNSGSHVLVSTYGTGDRGCWVGSWNDFVGSSSFQCVQTSDNTLADARFVAMMLEAGRVDKRWAYAWNSDVSAALNTPYTPNTGYQRQSNGQNVSMTRTATGVYTVTFPGLTRGSGSTDIILVSAYGTGSFAHCTVPGWSSTTTMTAEVRCVDRRTGAAANASFTILLLE